MRQTTSVFVMALAFTVNSPLMAREAEAVHMANGIKIGEVSSTSAILWTRLTKHAERNVNGTPFSKKENKNRKSQRFDNLPEMEGGVPGAVGEVRFAYWPKRDKAKKTWSKWQPVVAEDNFTYQLPLTGLSAGVDYSIIAEGRGLDSEKSSAKVEGSFRTAPRRDTPARVSFAVVTGQDYPRRDDKRNGHKIYPAMQKLGLNFFVHTGDIEYYDKPAPYADSVELARFKWNRIYSMPFQRTFHNSTASYFMKDDHDTLKNDCWPGESYGSLTWDRGVALFLEQVPMGEKTYRTIRWGKDLQIWLVEGRDFRSANKMPDGPKKTIWGEKQKQWFFDTVEKSDATFRILISPTPLVGPDREKKNDNHANVGFKHEGDELRAFVGKQKDMYVICGDRHWQYVSVDPKSGVREYSCGPTADSHAGGFREEYKSPMHRYLKIKGGFLSVVVNRADGTPQIILRHHGVDGSLYHVDLLSSEGEAR